jgi:transcriptional regulator with XRE-family HTH domain
MVNGGCVYASFLVERKFKVGNQTMDEQKAKTFGIMLRQRRHALGLTVRQVGESTGIASTTVSRIETGSFEAPRPDKLARIAQALKLSTGEVFAQAGYLDPADLPEYETYLRTKRPDLPESAIQSLHDHFVQILGQFNLVHTPQPALEEVTDESQGVAR